MDTTEMGIIFTSEDVARRNGSNDSDKRTIGKAQIATVTDIEKFVGYFGKDALLGAINGTSIRVMCQDVGRRAIEAKKTPEEMQQLVVNRLKGLRAAIGGTTRTVTVEVRKYALPDGTFYTGTDITEYRAAIMAAYSDMGIAADMARQIAEKMEF